MDPLEAIIAGGLQGFLEWLPVSYSGQLSLLIMNVFGIDPASAFKLGISLHLGTALSAMIFFRREVAGLVNDLIKKEFSDLLKFITISFITSVFIGFPIYTFFLSAIASVPLGFLNALIGVFLIITSAAIILAKSRITTPMLVRDAVLMGALQGLAILPGLSRSAVTIAYLTITGYSPRDAIKLSFIAAIPATMSAAVYNALKLEGAISAHILVVSLISALVAGLASILLMNSIASLSRKTWIFALIIGLLTLLLNIPSLLNGLI